MPDNRQFRIALLGPQGSGKGTQAALLAEALGVPTISTGELFRHHAEQQTLFGQQIAAYIDEGNLVPNEITNAIVEKRLAEADCHKGFILDGYPRTIEQVEFIEHQVGITQAVLIDLTNEQAVERIAGRVRCPHCGAGYHVTFDPPQQAGVCDHCHTALTVRKDDLEDVSLRRRLETYRRLIDPIVAYYERKGVLAVVDGMPSVEQVHKDIMRIFQTA